MATRTKTLCHFDSTLHASQLYVTFDGTMFWAVKELSFWVIRPEIEIFEFGQEFTAGQPVVDLVPGMLQIYGNVQWESGAGVLYKVDDADRPFRLVARAYDPIGDADYETSLLQCCQMHQKGIAPASFIAGTWVKWHRLDHSQVACTCCGHTNGHDTGCGHALEE
jgi:hypothetical protein